MYTRSFPRLLASLALAAMLPCTVLGQQPEMAPLAKPSVMFKIQSQNERMDITVRTSRILTMDQKIAQAQVSNPDTLELTPLSPNQIQVSAKATGVTQINLWGEDKKLYTIDVIVIGDSRELEMVLRSTFPSAALKIMPVSNAVLISGFVEQPEMIDRIVRVAEEYYPKVINNMTVGGVQQVLLHVKVMEVSRTKLRKLGFDFAKVTGSSVVTSTPAGLLTNAIDTTSTLRPAFAGATNSTFMFGIVNGSSAFFGVLEALRQDNLVKILSEPTLTTVSGRAASFNSGGEIPVPVPQSLGTISIEWKVYGTQIDFVPIVLGNGKIRLEVRPRVSELDDSRSILINGTTVPGIKSRQADTGVEMQAGQTLAMAGLVQTYIESYNGGLPWISEVPYLGAAFRKTKEQKNEVELLMLVTPQLVEAMDPNEVPPCGPGTQTTSPSDWELFMRGHLEVPKCCPAGPNGPCAQNGGRPTQPPEGLIQGPGEKVPTPQPMDGARSSNPSNRYNPTKAGASVGATPTMAPDGSPGFIGPVGYDDVK